MDSDMSNFGFPNKTRRGSRHRRRRGEFLDTLQQSQPPGRVPLVDVGKRLREIRTGSNLSIRELARKSGLNVNTLSMVENGKASPSLETLQRLSLALETPIVTFFEDTNQRKKIAHYKANQRPNMTFAYGSLEDLGEGMPKRGVETYLVTIRPNSHSGEHFIVHTGREIAFCLEGQLIYTIEDQEYILDPGDSLSFEAHLPHRWRNIGHVSSRSLLVFCPSDDQDRPAEHHFESVPIQGKEG